MKMSRRLMINDTSSSLGTKRLVCWRASKVTKSSFLWQDGPPFHVPTILFYFQLIVIFLVTSLVHFVLKPFNQISLVSQLVAGIILGPSCIGRITSLGEYMFPDRGVAVIETLTTFGVMCLLFTTGVKMDPAIMFHPGHTAIVIGIAICVSMILTIALAIVTTFHLPSDSSLFKSLPYIASAHTLTGFPAVSDLLSELHLLNTELSHIAIPTAMFSDVIGMSLSAVGLSFANNHAENPMNSFLSILSVVALLLVLVYVVKPLISRMIKKTPPGRPMGESNIIMVFCILFITGFMSEAVGHHYVLGPLFLGLIVPDGPPLGSALECKMEAIVSGLIYPAFITVTGLQTDIFEISLQSVWIVAIILITAYLIKFIAVLFSAVYCEVPFHEALVLAVTLNAKGIIEIILLNLWRNSEVLSSEGFALCVLSMLMITAVTSPITKALYHPLRQYTAVKRSTIQHARLDSELRILVCIHSHECVPMTMNLLEVSHASRESPIAVLGLVMVDLVGRTTPALVCHEKEGPQKFLKHTKSTSAHILNAFRNYEQNCHGFVSVRTYTAISEFQHMHVEICRVAADGRANILIVPFHKLWDVDGSVGEVKPAIRTMNLHILEKSPCSVGILIDRSMARGSLMVLSSRTPFEVAIIFIGGPDDAEALAYGSRMARHEFATVTVIRFLLFGSENSKHRHHDSDLIYQYRHINMGNDRFVYVEEVVSDGVALAAFMRDFANRFDLILVGRQHQESPIFEGLEQWSECQELGVIPDMLASQDFECKASVLVIQQHWLRGTLIGQAKRTVNTGEPLLSGN
ncbi:hypothetical protein MLD38_038186 [Melastoma candidum]|uniref:Uncharacterized protein n=1 Tax=Melastoma candidum TaxID=119954 RepID=A0ACB9KY62_9MYRT|nr:hypothetical protein MLD38_038186 [Melastoma candidum]